MDCDRGRDESGAVSEDALRHGGVCQGNTVVESPDRNNGFIKCYNTGVQEVLPDLGQLRESDQESLVLDLWTRLQAALAATEELRAQWEAAQASVAALTARVQELEARLGKPPKTPANSSLPPSQGEKPSKNRRRRKGRPGKGRKLHPQPDETVTLVAEQCPHCGAGLGAEEQQPQAVYDRIEIPPVSPHVTRVELHGCACPH